jgi:hypothetical protein
MKSLWNSWEVVNELNRKMNVCSDQNKHPLRKEFLVTQGDQFLVIVTLVSICCIAGRNPLLQK